LTAPAPSSRGWARAVGGEPRHARRVRQDCVASLLRMARWVPVATSDEVDRRPRRVGGPPADPAASDPAASEAENGALARLLRPLVLLRRSDGAVVAVLDGCPHLGTSLTAADVEGDELTCPAHVYSYDLVTGEHTTPGSPLAGCLELLPVREQDGAIEVDLDAVAVDVDGQP